MADISELDDRALHMRAAFKKSTDYMMSFCVDFFHVSQAIGSGRYGPEWTLNKWLMLKLHVSERHARRRIQMFKDALAADEREKFEKQTRELREERAQEKLEAAKKRLQMAQEKDAAMKEITRLKEAAKKRRARAKKKVTQADMMSARVTKPTPTLAPTPPPVTVATVRCVCPLCGDAHQALVKKPKLSVVS